MRKHEVALALLLFAAPAFAQQLSVTVDGKPAPPKAPTGLKVVKKHKDAHVLGRAGKVAVFPLAHPKKTLKAIF